MEDQKMLTENERNASADGLLAVENRLLAAMECAAKSMEKFINIRTTVMVSMDLPDEELFLIVDPPRDDSGSCSVEIGRWQLDADGADGSVVTAGGQRNQKNQMEHKRIFFFRERKLNEHQKAFMADALAARYLEGIRRTREMRGMS
jgi:hypothetical protein